MRERLPFPAQRSALNRLIRELDIDPSMLVKDGSGDWKISGAHGDIHALPCGYQLFAMSETAAQWKASKSKLDFAFVIKRNELSAIFWLSKMPTPEQGDAIRDALGIKARSRGPSTAMQIRSWRATA
jgi:hypothetical protein